ncbi:hypothetical protein ABIB07_007581 [Bradyrhizobium sp. RT10b]
MHGPELDPAAEQHARDAGRLRARIGEVEAPRDSLVEDVEVGGQDHPRLHHVQVMDILGVEVRERRGEDVGLLLIIALQAHPVP